uniref:Secreted protein n=1 Tax=Rhipicephalus appendiculatus TaxID=34631 RepID=A0A131YGA5_RHIAP
MYSTQGEEWLWFLASFACVSTNVTAAPTTLTTRNTPRTTKTLMMVFAETSLDPADELLAAAADRAVAAALNTAAALREAQELDAAAAEEGFVPGRASREAISMTPRCMLGQHVRRAGFGCNFALDYGRMMGCALSG